MGQTRGRTGACPALCSALAVTGARGAGACLANSRPVSGQVRMSYQPAQEPQLCTGKRDEQGAVRSPRAAGRVRRDDTQGFSSGVAPCLGGRELAGAGSFRRHSRGCPPRRRLSSCRRRRSCAPRRFRDPWPGRPTGTLRPLLTVCPGAPILTAKSIWPNRFGSPSRAGSRLISERALRPNGARTCPVPVRAGHRPANRRPVALRPSTHQASPPHFPPRSPHSPTPARPSTPSSRRQSTRMSVPIPRVTAPTVLVPRVVVPTPPGPRPTKVPRPACTPWTSRVPWGASCSSGSSTSS